VAKDQITAIVFGGDVLEWTSLRGGRERWKVDASGRIELPSSEEPAAVEQVKTALGDLKGEVVAGIAGEQLLLRIIDLPRVEDAGDLAGMVRLQVDKFSPFPVESMVVSHEMVSQNEDTCRVLVAAVQEKVVDVAGAVLKGAGIEPSRIDCAVLGWWHSLREGGVVGADGRHVAVLIDKPVPHILVFQDGSPISFRALAGIGMMEGSELSAELASEVGYTLMSLELEHGGAESLGVSVWHRGEAPEGLAESLRRECSCEARLGSIEDLPSASEGLARRAAAGGALLDLVPGTWRATEKARTFRRGMLTVLAVLAGVWVLLLSCLFGGLVLQERKLEALKAEQARWREPALAVRELRRRVFMIRSYTDRVDSGLECLREISMLLPAGVDLVSFSYKKDEEVRIGAEADNVRSVYEFKETIDASELFPESTLQGPRSDRRRRKELFDITMALAGGEEL